MLTDYLRLTIASFIFLLLWGCGQTGPLTMPLSEKMVQQAVL